MAPMTPAGLNLLAAARRGLERVQYYDARLESAVANPLSPSRRPGVAEALADARQAVTAWKRATRPRADDAPRGRSLEVHARLWLAEIVTAACSGKRITPATVRRVSLIAENLAWAAAAPGARNRATARHIERWALAGGAPTTPTGGK